MISHDSKLYIIGGYGDDGYLESVLCEIELINLGRSGKVVEGFLGEFRKIQDRSSILMSSHNALELQSTL